MVWNLEYRNKEKDSVYVDDDARTQKILGWWI